MIVTIFLGLTVITGVRNYQICLKPYTLNPEPLVNIVGITGVNSIQTYPDSFPKP